MFEATRRKTQDFVAVRGQSSRVLKSVEDILAHPDLVEPEDDDDRPKGWRLLE